MTDKYDLAHNSPEACFNRLKRSARHVGQLEDIRVLRSSHAAQAAEIERLSGMLLRECNCMKIQQDESCPVGYPSLLCDECDGKGWINRVSEHKAVLAEVVDAAKEFCLAYARGPWREAIGSGTRSPALDTTFVSLESAIDRAAALMGKTDG